MTPNSISSSLCIRLIKNFARSSCAVLFSNLFSFTFEDGPDIEDFFFEDSEDIDLLCFFLSGCFFVELEGAA